MYICIYMYSSIFRDLIVVLVQVMTTVVGKKQPVRGQAFRAANGDYVSYLCTDDDTIYRPGGPYHVHTTSKASENCSLAME